MSRSRQQILDDYVEACKHDEMRVAKGYERVYEYTNIEKRNDLREEYIQTLDDEEQIAIKLMRKLERAHSAEVNYEISGITDDWNGYFHKKYLNIAKKMFQTAMDKGVMVDDIFNVIDGIVECL